MPQVTGERAAVLRPIRPLPPWAPLVSLLLHGAALVGVLVLLERSHAPEAAPEHGVEVVWDQAQESELVSGEPTPAQPPMVEAPPQPEATREPPPPPTPAPPLAAPPPPQAMRAPPEIAPPPPVPEPTPVPPAEPAPTLAMPLPPPAPEAVQPMTLPPPSPPAAEAEPEPEPAEEIPLPPPLPPPAPPRPEPSRQAPARQQASPPAAAQPGPTAPAQASVPTGGSQASGRVIPPGLLSGVRNAEPEYPFASRQRGEQGVVGVVIRVAEDGSVLAVEVAQSSGYPALDDSARRAVMQWKLKPAMRDGVPIPGSIRTAIHFSLR
jgi:protein TonB